MNKSLLLFLSVQIAVILSAPQVRYKLPSFVGVCSRNENNLAACIKDKAQKTLSGLAQGSKEIGLTPLDPLEVAEMRVDYEQETFKGVAVAKDSVVLGIGKIKVQDARANVTENGGLNMELDIFIPKLTLEGQFKISGQIAQIPLGGKGYYNMSLADLAATWRIETVPIKKDGDSFLKVVRFPITYTVKDMKTYADNLVDNSPELSAFALQAVNQFWPFLIREAQVYAAEPFERYMKAVANKVFLSYPTSVLFP